MKPDACGSETMKPWEDMRNASVAAREARKAGWPPGPKDYKELFQWHQYNAGVLLSTCEHAKLHRECFIDLASRGFVHHDAFSGLGTASITFKQQLQSLHCFVAGLEGALSAAALWGFARVHFNFC